MNCLIDIYIHTHCHVFYVTPPFKLILSSNLTTVDYDFTSDGHFYLPQLLFVFYFYL